MNELKIKNFRKVSQVGTKEEAIPFGDPTPVEEKSSTIPTTNKEELQESNIPDRIVDPSRLAPIFGKVVKMEKKKVYTSHFAGQSYYKLHFRLLEHDEYTPAIIMVDAMKEKVINEQLWEDVLGYK